jgi:hypothetical protein
MFLFPKDDIKVNCVLVSLSPSPNYPCAPYPQPNKSPFSFNAKEWFHPAAI